ncbi:MAG: lipoate--protein ligase family protein [Verrucomicrobiota bacterium]|jgi:lipoate-protein ligase A
MKLLDLTLPSPAENLACDEALLDAAETGDGGEILRFWEPCEHFVVVGYANRVATEVNVAACEARGIPVLRRCSGGGTVVQGPGCLNYTLVLRITADGPLHNIGVANQFIMRQNRAAIESAIRNPQSAIAVRGHTDLAIRERKFSGNSQRRRKHFLLFHGTFLLNFDLAFVSELLPMPSKQPEYRESRPHDRFLTNLKVSADKVKVAMRQTWKAEEPLKNLPLEEITALSRDKYATREWNFKF